MYFSFSPISICHEKFCVHFYPSLSLVTEKVERDTINFNNFQATAKNKYTMSELKLTQFDAC